MRILLLLRGAPGCGKSTWVRENSLEPFTISVDELRLLYGSPELKTDGTYGISHDHEAAVWELLQQILRERMCRGDFTVIDATCSRTVELGRYRKLGEEYRYRIYCVDFTDVPVEKVKRRNAAREPFRRVPESVIDTMYARFATQKIPSGITVIRPEELDGIWLRLRDFSHYKRIHHIGDIHGCNSVLQKYLAENGGMKEDEYYLFTGDYIDRGAENAQVVQFLISIMDRKNVLLLEGNHERNLWKWAKGEPSHDREFEKNTAPALEEAGISRKDVRNLYRRLGQCAYYRYDENIYLVTHAGLSTIPENLSLVATEQMTEGVGSFEDSERIAEAFRRTTLHNCIQIYGHRNMKRVSLSADNRVFNLEGRVEHGGCLRCLQVDHDGIRPVETGNEVFRSRSEKFREKRCEMSPSVDGTLKETSALDLPATLRSNPYIQEKSFGNISSFNYTDQVFYHRIWNEQTIKARGLYLDTVKGTVAARSYDKFFNIGEREETGLDALGDRLQFPLTAYVKENGFLGIVSYDEYTDDLLVACKSTTDSRFAQWFGRMLREHMDPGKWDELKAYVREKNVSFIFECIDMENDPHIIDYPDSRLILLDIVHNRMEFLRLAYEEMCAVADRFDLRHKEKAFEILNWQDFFDWYQAVREEEYEYEGRKIEGFVLEDAGGYMVKLKLAYYRFWKFMRSISREVMRKGVISDTSVLTTATANEFYGWLRKQYETGELKRMPKDICGLRKRFYGEGNR